METAEIKPVMVTGDHHHYTIVGEDETIWGLGYRVQGSGRENCKLRKMEKPGDCIDYKKVTSGKF